MTQQLGQRAAGRLFIRVGQAGRAAEAHVDRCTMPLFPLPVIMDAEGTLAADARHLARGGDPETSHAAAARAKSIVGEHERLIFEAIKSAGDKGACSKEIARATGLTHVQVDRRLGAMGARGHIKRLYVGAILVKRQHCAVWVVD